MSEDTEQWTVQLVKATSVGSLDGFVHVVFGGADRDNPLFKLVHGELWKSACSIKVWDDGRVFVRAESHLTSRQRGIVAGLAEEYWRGGPERCRREQWRRIRRNASRPVGSRATCFWVRADHGEPGFAAAHADFRETAAQSHPSAHDSASERWFLEGADASWDGEVVL
jgi:hypothetical protein